MVRRPNVPAILIISSIYWGALLYWQWDELFGTNPEHQMRSLYATTLSIPYVAFIMWGTSTDLPDHIQDMKFIGRGLKPGIWLTFFFGAAIWGWNDPAMVGFLLVGIILMGLMAGLCLTCLLYTGDESSRLYGLKRLVDVYPSISKPEGHVRFNSKLWTTTFVLIIYFAMTNVMIWGLSEATIDVFSSFRAIMAGASGSIMHLGIGPIVTGSIIMQLFAGAKIIKLDLGDSDDKQLYQGIQKILVLIMIPVESIPQVYGFLEADLELVGQFGQGWANAIIVGQLFIGSLLVFLLDEMVSKWGIGSGISLFIAAGVAQSTFVGTLSPLSVNGGAFALENPPAGTLPMIFYTLRTASFSEMVSANGFESILLGDAAHPNAVVALFSSVIVFLVVAYAESSKLELPLTHGKVRGHRGQYPIRLVYALSLIHI